MAILKRRGAQLREAGRVDLRAGLALRAADAREELAGVQQALVAQMLAFLQQPRPTSLPSASAGGGSGGARPSSVLLASDDNAYAAASTSTGQ